MKLSQLKNGETAVILRVSGHGGFRKRIMEMGFVRGQKVTSVMNSPLNDPVKYTVMGYDISMRRSEAEMIEILMEDEATEMLEDRPAPVQYSLLDRGCPSCGSGIGCGTCGCGKSTKDVKKMNVINVALVGNPNSGKSSLFNALSGGNEKVGNYGGVTVSAKTGHFNYKGYRINLTDLPGTYSLSAYTPEEIFVRNHLFTQKPDVIINAVVASNLERNFYLTTELIDLSQRVVVALNMYDELCASGSKLEYENLGAMVGIPMVPTVAKNGQGLDKLLNTVIELFEGTNKVARHIHIQYGTELEQEISGLSDELKKSEDLPWQFPSRYWAMKLMEKDSEVDKLLAGCDHFFDWRTKADAAAEKVERDLGKDVETAISDYKYGFISGALQETFTMGSKDANRNSRRIDRLVANKWLGFPLFLFLMWLMFTTTYDLGAYPQDWIAAGCDALGNWLSGILPDGGFKDLLINGIIGGVGSVIIFIPNILILYLFISLMEDSGYMARAAFIMDKLMHKMGLHGKSFIPLLMGFGCNVPAIIAARTIESRSSRLITILVIPFMSCTARLPVFILLAGTFFPHHAALVLIGLYLVGLMVAVFTARLLRKTKFQKDETPFVMELPPYRWPTVGTTLKHVWDRCLDYMKKIGTVVLLSAIVIWFLSYYPRPEQTPEMAASSGTEYVEGSDSYIARIGKFIEPVMAPMGLNWKASVALVSSIPAKELVVSTLGVLYSDENEETLSTTLLDSGDFTPRSVMAFMVFILLFFPCIATVIAIAHEAGSRKWAFFTLIYNTVIAWLVAYLVYLIGGFFW